MTASSRPHLRVLLVAATLAGVLATAGAVRGSARDASHPVAVHPAFATLLAAPARHGARARARAHSSRQAKVRAHTPQAPKKRPKRPQQIAIKPTPAAAAPGATPVAVTPNDPAYAQEWNLKQVRAPEAWQVSADPHQVIVAVIDSGVDPAQPDLQGALVPGHNFVDGNDDTADAFGHGTMVAGVIAARGNNGIGVAGACWTCSIMPIKVLDANGAGTSTSIADGMRWAVDHGALVLNLSVALSGDDPAVAAAVAYAHDRGALVVAAAGNAGSTDRTFPASYPNVISVAGTDNADHAYPWTTHGDWVTVAAPGCAMTTARGGAYGEFCGTSAAAPLVAGLAGLALATGRPTAGQVEAALQTSAQALPGIVGRGRVDALGLLQQVLR